MVKCKYFCNENDIFQVIKRLLFETYMVAGEFPFGIFFISTSIIHHRRSFRKRDNRRRFSWSCIWNSNQIITFNKTRVGKVWALKFPSLIHQQTTVGLSLRIAFWVESNSFRSRENYTVDIFYISTRHLLRRTLAQDYPISKKEKFHQKDWKMFLINFFCFDDDSR